MRQSCVLFLLGIFISGILFAAQVDIPKLKTRVTDLTQTLSAEQHTQLTQQLSALEHAKGSQLAVLIVPTTGDESIEQFSIRVSDQWQLGRHGIDDGVLLLVAKDDKKVRIEVGRGLEGALPDVKASRIIREYILPAFRQGDYADGIMQGVAQISGVIRGESFAAPATDALSEIEQARRSGHYSMVSPSIMFAILMFIAALHFYANRQIALITLGTLPLAAAILTGFSIWGALQVLLAYVACYGLIYLTLYCFVGQSDPAPKTLNAAAQRKSKKSRKLRPSKPNSSAVSGGVSVLSIATDLSSSHSDSGDRFSGGGGNFGGGGASGSW